MTGERKCDRNESAIVDNNQSDNPLNVSHNMNDLEVLRFNSADAIRQTFKRTIIALTKTPKFTIDEMATHSRNAEEPPDNIKTTDVNHDEKSDKEEEIQNEKKKSETQTVERKKRGRPLNSKTAKRRKKDNVSAMYNGKLNNVVFNNRYSSDSDSDFS